jgi:hypothetical protein
VADPRTVVGEWRHGWQVIGLLRARPPRGNVVLYFGDSTARESLVSDASWTRELRRLGARARAFTLASHGQTFRTDRRLLDFLPRLHGVALIGVSLSRFVGPPLRGPAGRPFTFKHGTKPRLSRWNRHLYTTRAELPPAGKQARVVHWQLSRTGKFHRFKAANLHALARLVVACRRHGLRPVLVELPLNTAVVGHQLDPQKAALWRGCRRVAAKYGARFLDFQVAPGLSSADFYDICHLIRSGAVQWQHGLSRWTARLLPRRG